MKVLTALKQHTKSAGFTMIELLIVIAILGILAVAVLSAINPVEQINRGRDTGSRSDTEQLISAIDRFQAFQGFYPWTSGAGEDYTISPAVEVLDTWVIDPGDGTADCSVLARLGSEDTGDNLCVNTDELKLSFIQRISETSYNSLWIYNRGNTGDSTYVCFEPQSNAFRQEAVTRCTNGLPDDIDTTTQDQICVQNGQTTNIAGGDEPMICLP